MKGTTSARAALAVIALTGSGLTVSVSADAVELLRGATADITLEVFRQAVHDGKLTIEAGELTSEGNVIKLHDFSDAFRDSFKDKSPV